MAGVTIAQWENECISLSVLSVARVMIAQWENECISLSVLSVARVMIARWENECISLSVLSMARVQFPAVQGIFPWLITNTWRGYGCRRVVTSRLKGYEEHEAKQLLLPSDLPSIEMVMDKKT